MFDQASCLIKTETFLNLSGFTKVFLRTFQHWVVFRSRVGWHFYRKVIGVFLESVGSLFGNFVLQFFAKNDCTLSKDDHEKPNAVSASEGALNATTRG